MKKVLLFFLLLAFGMSYGQSVKGEVKDNYNNPLVDVNIVNISNDKHTHTDEKGLFAFKGVGIGDTLQFSYVGYQIQKVKVDALDAELKIVLVPETISLEEIVISPDLDALNIVTKIDIKTNPVSSSQEILRKVPGLFIGQHAGGGKAEQIFLRGFDIDHGTDVRISVDGMPVNMVSHAHGQGYADLHFLIPETIEKIDFGKGTYNVKQGNFSTAGYVGFKTKNRFENNLVKLEAGQFNTKRMLTAFNLVDKQHHHAYIASEYLLTDGPFKSPQNFDRINLLGKYAGKVSANNEIELSVSHFASKWDASGQIPQRAIDSKKIGWFGAIDDTEGGFTSRQNIILSHKNSLSQNSFLTNRAYFSDYNFELYSNFTFFLNDSINGDQIKQKEHRNIYGLSSEYNYHFSGQLDGELQVGVSVRNDQTEDTELSHTLNRKTTLKQIQSGDIHETNFGSYANAVFNFGKWTINPAVRLDYFNFKYYNNLEKSYKTKANNKSILSPKLNILYSVSDNMQWYIKAGKGFHSNDTRVVLEQKQEKILPSAYGADVGFIWKPNPKMIINSAYWYLFLEQEFVYVGDEGVVEASGKTARQGVDVGIRYQPVSWLFLNFDANYAHARSVEEAKGEDFIPLAPDFTWKGGINVLHPAGFFGGVNARHVNNRPANEDNSITAVGYTVVDLNVGYEWKVATFGVQIQNLLDTKWKETQFATTSRLQSEPKSVEEIHFTPGTPFMIKGSISFRF